MSSTSDLRPYLALALGLKARGHHAVAATGEYYRAKIEGLGLGFRAVRPDADREDAKIDADPKRRSIGSGET